MKKLKLDVDALRVEPFDASPATAERDGTVNAHEYVAGASASWCAPCFTDGPLCDPLTTYRCA